MPFRRPAYSIYSFFRKRGGVIGPKLKEVVCK